MYYFLNYDMGVHHDLVLVDRYDFERVIGGLSEEFEIHKKVGDLPFLTIYYIYNYYGDAQNVGATINLIHDISDLSTVKYVDGKLQLTNIM